MIDVAEGMGRKKGKMVKVKGDGKIVIVIVGGRDVAGRSQDGR